MTKQKFYLCKHCGNLAGMIHASGVTPVCCGDPMTLLEANTVDASAEKHVPVIMVEEGFVKVNVGAADHPMIEEHFIQWIYLQTKNGGQRKVLSPGEAPAAVFALKDDEPVTVFAYCNLHGLWKADA